MNKQINPFKEMNFAFSDTERATIKVFSGAVKYGSTAKCRNCDFILSRNADKDPSSFGGFIADDLNRITDHMKENQSHTLDLTLEFKARDFKEYNSETGEMIQND